MVTRQAGSQKLDVHGTTLAMHSCGAGEPTVIFISGLGDPASVWRSVIERLEDVTTLLSYDRAGCGESGDLAPSEASSPQPAAWAAEQLYELLNRANVRRPIVLVGHSLGGQIADAFAIRWPSMVAGLVLVDAVDAELNLVINPPRTVLDDAEPPRAGRGWKWDVAASAEYQATTNPVSYPPTVVIASAIWRWFQAKRPELYQPLSLSEVDQRWQLAQLQYAHRWSGRLVVAHEGGHRLHEEAPELLATAISAVVEAAADGGQLRLDRKLVQQSGGSVRPTSAAD